MKKFLHIRKIAIVCILLVFFVGNLFAEGEKKTIVFVYDATRIDAATGLNPDIPMMELFEEEGYTVHRFTTIALNNATQEQIDSLNASDLVYIGRAVGSANFSSPNKEKWNEITAPVMTSNMWGLRTSRANWFASDDGAAANYVGEGDQVLEVKADILEEDDIVFENKVSGNVSWWTGNFSTINVTDAGNGQVLATKSGDPGNGAVLFVRFEAYTEFYPGSVDTPSGERIYIGNACDHNSIFNYYGYTDEIKRVFLNEVGRVTGTFVSANKISTLKPSVYPMPAANSLNVEMENLSKVQIMDVAGRSISTHVANSRKLSLDVSNLNKGIYMLKIQDNKGNAVMRKITKE